jgi:hypothetical protein
VTTHATTTHATDRRRTRSPDRLPAACLAACLAAGAVAGLARGADRLRMQADNVVEIDARDCVQAAARAVAEENLDAFIDCFSERQRPRLRRKAAILFARHVLDLELLDAHVLSRSDSRAELAVKYRATLTDDSFDIVSVLGLVKEGEAWRIAREKVESNTAVQRYESSMADRPVFPFGGGDAADDLQPADAGRRKGGCANGRCGL